MDNSNCVMMSEEGGYLNPLSCRASPLTGKSSDVIQVKKISRAYFILL
jgi:hypothetical protein